MVGILIFKTILKKNKKKLCGSKKLFKMKRCVITSVSVYFSIEVNIKKI